MSFTLIISTIFCRYPIFRSIKYGHIFSSISFFAVSSMSGAGSTYDFPPYSSRLMIAHIVWVYSKDVSVSLVIFLEESYTLTNVSIYT